MRRNPKSVLSAVRRVGLSVAALVTLAPSGAGAAESYGALDEVPAGGGELRLSAPRGEQDGAPAGPNGEPAIAFPLTHTRVDVHVQGPMAEVVVDQTFENPFDDPLEAVYVFPMADGAAVNGYEIHIGERLVRGEIREREAARAAWEAARDAGHTAGLLEQVKANVFLQSIANIAPREEIRVRLRYVEMLRYADDGYELVYPMTVMPRYLPESTSDGRPVDGRPAGQPGRPGTTSVPYVASGRSGHDVEIHVHVDAGVPVLAVESTSHGIVTTPADETSFDVVLEAGDTIPNRDFVLRFETAGEQTMVGLLTHKKEDDGFVAMIVQPKARYFEGDITPREVILLVDVSGSMGGPPLEIAKAVAHGLIDTLNAGDTLNVITFASRAAEMGPAPVDGDAAGRRRGHDYVRGLRAGGGTEMNSGVTRALARPPEGGRVRMVYLMTDGGVGNDDEVLASLRQPEGESRIFPLGVGAAPNRYLLDRLGDEGRGFATYIDLGEPVADVVDELVRRTAWPYLTDVRVDWGGLDVRDVTPAILPDVFAGLPIVAAGRYARPGKAEVVVAGRRAGGDVEIRLPIELPDEAHRPPVAFFWARSRIEELMASQYGREDARVVAEVTRLGLEFGLVTAYTSYVAIDEGRVVAGEARQAEQPNEVPAGVDPGGVFGGGAPGGSGGGYGGSGGGYGSSGGSGDWGGDGGAGDLDPITLAAVFGLLALALSRRRQGRTHDGPGA